jgi:chaperonin GroES
LFQPCHNLVTVVPDPKNSKTKGGLHLPDTFAEIFLTGTVRAIGPGRLTDTGYVAHPGLKVGDKVMLAQHSQTTQGGQRRVQEFPTVLDEGVTVLICDVSEILGVVESAPLH